MITTAFANQFAQAWVVSWNSHNIDSILGHYTDDFIIETPMASKLIPERKGRCKKILAHRAGTNSTFEI